CFPLLALPLLALLLPALLLGNLFLLFGLCRLLRTSTQLFRTSRRSPDNQCDNCVEVQHERYRQETLERSTGNHDEKLSIKQLWCHVNENVQEVDRYRDSNEQKADSEGPLGALSPAVMQRRSEQM